jgi:hypothetical protein
LKLCPPNQAADAEQSVILPLAQHHVEQTETPGSIPYNDESASVPRTSAEVKEIEMPDL